MCLGNSPFCVTFSFKLMSKYINALPSNHPSNTYAAVEKDIMEDKGK